MRCWSPLTRTRCEPDRLASVHPSRFSAASIRAALAMDSTVGHGSDKTAVPAALGVHVKNVGANAFLLVGALFWLRMPHSGENMQVSGLQAVLRSR